jgi:hypothetical protein
MPTTSAMPMAIDSAEKNVPPKACREAVSVTRPAPVIPAHERDQGDLLADGHVLPRGLHDEQRAQRQVDAGAVEVERVPGREHDAHALARRAGALELDEHARQHGLRGGGAEDDEQLVLEQTDELQDREPVEASDETEHDEDEHRRRAPEGHEQQREAL